MINKKMVPYLVTPFKNWTKLKMIAGTVLTGVILGGESENNYIKKFEHN